MKASYIGKLNDKNINKLAIRNDIRNKGKSRFSEIEITTTNSPDKLTVNISRPFVLGAVDGLVTSFVIIAAGFTAEVSKKSTIVIGVSSLVADAFSMGVSEYLSTRHEQDLKNSIKTGFACFISFVTFGGVPLIAFSIANTRDLQLTFSIVSFLIALTVLGSVHGYVTNARRKLKRLFEILTLGTIAGGIAFGVASVRIE